MKSQHWTLRCGPAGNWDVNKSNTLPVPQKHSATRNFEQHVMINCFIFISFLCCAFLLLFSTVLLLLLAKKKVLYKMICFGTASASASYASCVSSIQGCPQMTNLYYLVSQVHCDGTATPSNMAFSWPHYNAIYIFVLQQMLWLHLDCNLIIKMYAFLLS